VLTAVTLVGVLFLALALWDRANGAIVLRPAAIAAAAALAVWLVLRLPAETQLWAALHGSASQYTVASEDASGVALIKATPSSLGRSTAGVFIEGIGQSWIPFGGIHSALGALPAFLHPQPRTAAVIGLGSGDTVYALAGRDTLARIVCAEIVRPQLPALRDWEQRTRYPALGSLLSDARITMHMGDGRAYLMRSAERFDIIEADALRPSSAYSGNVYSTGYFELLRSRLAPGGIAVTWTPTERVRDTFLAVFPYALSFGQIVIGSDTPVAFSADEVRARTRAADAQEHYRNAGEELDELLAPYLAGAPVVTTPATPRHPDDLNEDLFPRDEFGVPQRGAS
jgi:spermidine synthase